MHVSRILSCDTLHQNGAHQISPQPTASTISMDGIVRMLQPGALQIAVSALRAPQVTKGGHTYEAGTLLQSSKDGDAFVGVRIGT